ncbi:MAG: tyrosine-type recombinase/integrase [Acetobacteraceae bacterium]|nr:tyrosine-type recombinase/integrase [Acetobacteraceae bacterium]
MRNPAPNDLAARIAMVIQLNAAADSVAPAELARRGSIAWVIHRYCDSDQYAALSAGTVKYYRRFLREIEALGPALPFASFTRRVVVNFIETYTKRHQRRQAAAVLKNLFGIARYYGIVTTDEAAGLRLKTTPPRDRIWTSEEVARWLEAAAREDPHMSTAFLIMILQFSALRPSDVLKMSWPQYSGSAIRLRQQKTGALLDFPVHPVLREHLDTLPHSSTSLTIVAYRGRPVKYLRFNERFRRIAERARIDAQAPDLCRTAMVRMAEAGATVPQIASVSGHSIEATQRILETYLPRNRDLAEIAITRLAEYKRRTESTALDKKEP